jgi:large repetitive protein
LPARCRAETPTSTPTPTNTNTPTAISDIFVDKIADTDSAEPEQTIVYTINYGNAGNQEALSVVLIEKVPTFTFFEAGASSAGWSCADGSPAGTECILAIGTLQPGENGTRYFAVTVGDSEPGVIFNVVQIGDLLRMPAVTKSAAGWVAR